MNTGYLYPGCYDLVTPDGFIKKLEFIDATKALAVVQIEGISPAFVGYQLEPKQVVFNFKSALAQLGLNTREIEHQLDARLQTAEVKLEILAMDALAKQMLPLLQEGMYVGKLFAADERRKVQNPDYLLRMFGRADRESRPLLSLGGMQGSDALTLEKVDGAAVAFLTLQEGVIEYNPSIVGLLPTLVQALKRGMPVRDLVRLHQEWKKGKPKIAKPGEILLVASLPLHIRTVFARVVDGLLPEGYRHTSANVLQPDTEASGDIYELYGSATKEVFDIPLEFYKLEPHREHVFFVDRDQLQVCLESDEEIFKAFKTAPAPIESNASVFVVKGTQMKELSERDWIVRDPKPQPLPGIPHPIRQSLMVERYIEQQPSYPFLKAIESGLITSQGVLLTRYFPSPMMKRMLLSYYVQGALMGVYFQIPSRSNGSFFSQEDRALLTDLVTFGIPVFWVDETSKQVLQYLQRPRKTSGMFVPRKKCDLFNRSTFFGIYGSNLIAGNFGEELKKLLEGILKMREEMDHPLLSRTTPLALVTGGGPGAMEMGNKMAKELGILSCANIVDFRKNPDSVVNEQKQNPYVEAKMTYRLDQLIERQAEFFLDFPIFVMGGIGTDFEFSLEEVRHKVGARVFCPILLFGDVEYWKEKITTRFQCNRKHQTIVGSEWVSNSMFCIQRAEQGLRVYRDFFLGKLPIGDRGPIYEEGFVIVEP